MRASVGGPTGGGGASSSGEGNVHNGGGGGGGGGEEAESVQWEHHVYYYRPTWYRPLLIGASAVCTAFAAGYQAVAVAGWLQYFLLLRYLEWDRRRLRHWITAWLVHAVGFVLAMAGSFNNPKWTASGPTSVLVVALVVAAFEVLCGLVYVTMAQRYPKRLHAKVLAFPVTLTAFWFLWGLVSPTGAFGHPATSQWTLPPIIQLTAAFGLDGVLFLMAWTAAVLATYFDVFFGPPSEEEEDDGDRPFSSLGPEAQRDQEALKRRVEAKARCQLATWCYASLFLLLVGGANITVFHATQFYQRTLPETIGAQTPLKLGCVIASDVARNESTELWRRTEAAAAMGNDFVIWSEEGLVLHGQAEEAEAVAQAAALAVQEQVYLGITYQLYDPGSPSSPTDPAAEAAAEKGPYANVFTLLKPDGAVGFRYAKRHPVPIVEAQAVAGHARAPPHVDTPWGRVGGAICFDLDFPLWAKEAGRARVALMLQPSWTWGPLGQLHAFDSAIRGVENGFALFRCSSGGVSGYWDATYGVQSLTYTTLQANGPTQVIVPPPKARVTLYPWVGFVFGWLALAFACGYLIVLLGPGEKAMRVAAARFRKGGAGGGIRRTGGAGAGAAVDGVVVVGGGSVFGRREREALMSPAEGAQPKAGWAVT